MFNILSHQQNANQNNSESLPYTCKNDQDCPNPIYSLQASWNPTTQLAPILRGPKRQPQQGLDQDTKTLPASFEGRDGQVPMQEFLHHPKEQYGNTRTQQTHKRKT